jgi:hypothetical protein
MKRAWMLLVLASIFFVAYLFSPSFVGAVKGDGTRVIGLGWGEVVFYFICLTCNIPQDWPDAITYLLIIPISLANVIFCILPFLYFINFFGLPRLRFWIAGIFAIGGAAYGWLVKYKITLEAGVGFGAYFWIAAAIIASIYCLLTDNKSGCRKTKN